MLLTETEIQQILQLIKAAFPKLGNWDYNNDENNQDYYGFSVWGSFTINPKEFRSSTYYVTFSKTDKNEWNGYLTIGKHSYFWSSTELNDAYLLSTERCDSLEATIKALKSEILELFQLFSII